MKPTYEQLEQQIAVAISERDAAVKAELVWEKSMMEACGEDGPASVAAEIAALRAQRDTALESLRQQLSAVVTENAGLKSAMSVTLEHVSVMDTGQAGVAAMIINDALHHSETPATDAFLAEVRAQGVEMFALMFAEEAIKSNNITTGWRAKASRAASEYAEALREDAAKLR